MPQSGTLAFEIHGSGRPLVLLHGHTLNRQMWYPLLPLLTPHVQAILVDLPGHGESSPTPEGSTPAEQLLHMLDALHVNKAAVCGHSQGGAVAVSFALTAPDRCAALIAVDTALGGFPFPSWPGPRPYIRQARSEGLGPALEAWMQDPIFGTIMASPLAEELRAIVRAYPGHEWLNRSQARKESVPDAGRLGEIAAPTLVLLGEQDLPDFHTIAKVLVEGIPGAKQVVIPAAGHMLPMEQPEATAQAILSFLFSLPA